MLFTSNDMEQLEALMNESPENRELLEKLQKSHQYTISKISHEIRNPLALVYSTFQLIESQHPETKKYKHWDDMRQDIEFMNKLLDELSVYNNGERLKLKQFSPQEFFNHMCLSVASFCVDTNVEFTSKIQKNLPKITGDPVKLQEVFLNLLKNAFEATYPSGSFRLDVLAEASLLKVMISDKGCGIPAEHLPTIFEPFVTHKNGGSGLGLSIAQKTIEAHNGRITVESEMNKGTTFTITLPVA